ncbi:MAG: acyl-CoA dehydrogenase family protein [Candidatus Binatia bacterium]
MDFALTDEQRAIQDLAQQIFRDQAAPKRVAEIEAGNERIDRDLWQQLATASLLGAALPEEFGGSNLGFFELCLVLEAAGRNVAPVPLVPVLVLAALPIAQFGTPDQKKAYLPRIATGEALLTAALVEPALTDVARPRTTARHDGSHWRLDGEKVCVPIGQLAERILVPARTDDGGVAIFLLDPSSPGVSREGQWGTNREPQARVLFSGVRVAGGDLLGTPQQGEEILRWIDERAALCLCALQLGIAEQALRLTAEYTSTRKQFERPIGTFQGVALRAADGYIDVEAMRSIYWEAAWRLTAGLPASAEIAAAKWWACMAGHRVAHTAQHLHGGIGADVEYPIHRYFLWAKQVELQLGGANKQLARLGAMLQTI